MNHQRKEAALDLVEDILCVVDAVLYVVGWGLVSVVLGTTLGTLLAAAFKPGGPASPAAAVVLFAMVTK